MTDFQYSPELTKSMTQGMNNSMLNNNINPGVFRKPDFFVYIYNIGQKEHLVARPPMIPGLLLKKCPEGQEFVECAKLAHPYEQSDRNVDTGEVIAHFHDARRVAMDIICPFAVDMDSALPADAHTVDLREQGVFWSLQNPPTEKEVKAAHVRREKYYRKLLERATALEYTNPKELYERINEDYHHAADYFPDEEFSWHKKPVRRARKVACPYCGDEIKAGVAFHKSEDGDLCILDWKRAYEAGKVTLKQVPEDKRWEGFKLSA